MFRRKPPLDAPEWLIVGLGNPGAQYDGTRHNVGFDVVERLSREHAIKLSVLKHSARYGQGALSGRSVVLAKPMTFMNLSGRAVGALVRQFGLAPEHVLVVSDELDLPSGVLRLRAKGGPAGHNGHRSIIAALGTNEYPRLRVGIGRPEGDGADHVLSKFSSSERDGIVRAIELATRIVGVVVADGVDAGIAELGRSQSG